MSNSLCRWGFLGTAAISRKNWQAVCLAENATLVAVASREIRRSSAFVDKCQAVVPFEQPPQAIGGYDNLLARDDVDAVYIPLPTGIRKEWVIKAARAGKHVLCEKPCAVNSQDLSEMLLACENNNVQFMDGVMFMHSKRLDAIREIVDSKQLGSIRRIYSQFSFLADDEFRRSNIRTDCMLEPDGCLGDLGWYNIRFLLWALNWQLPTSVRATALSSSKRTANDVPIEFAAELYFENGISAGFFCSFEAGNQQSANISGSNGYVHIRDFVLPYSGEEIEFDVTNSRFDVSDCTFEMSENRVVHSVEEPAEGAANSQEANMFRNFSAIAFSGKTDRFWFDVAVNTQLVMEHCLLSARNNGSLITF